MSFSQWYQKNGKEYNRRRAERLASDPEYAARQKQYRKQTKDNKKSQGVQLIAAVSLSDVSRELDIPVWKLNVWRARGYLPSLFKHEGKIWMSEYNLPLLKLFAQKIKLVSNDEALSTLVDWLLANWHELEKRYGTES